MSRRATRPTARQPLELAVLKRRGEISDAEVELHKRGLTGMPGRSRWPERALRRVLRQPASSDLEPDPIKSWDVLRAIDAVTSSVSLDDPVLDVGSVASAILPFLHRLGYRRLAGIDLDARVLGMPNSDTIEYVVGDLTQTKWPDRSFAAITAISVIEHGVELDALVQEVSRLLRPGGVFIFSTDYWPEGIDTRGVTLFGLPWRIFSADDIEDLLRRAATHGLTPVSDPSASIRDVAERPIHFENQKYTFLFGALIRSRQAEE